MPQATDGVQQVSAQCPLNIFYSGSPPPIHTHVCVCTRVPMWMYVKLQNSPQTGGAVVSVLLAPTTLQLCRLEAQGKHAYIQFTGDFLL